MRNSFILLISMFLLISVNLSVLRADDLPELLLKHREALGGTEAIQSIKTMQMKTHFSMMIIEGEIETIMMAPDKQWLKMESNVVSFTEASNGLVKWKIDQNDQLTKNDDPYKLMKSADVLSDYQYLFPNEEISVKDLGNAVLDEKTYRVLEVNAPGFKKSRKKYIDPETFLCMHEDAEEDGISISMDYSDYQVIDGVQIAGKIVQQPMMAGVPPSTLTLKSVVFNKPVELSLFDPPVSEEIDFTFPESHQAQVPMIRHGEHLVIQVSINGKGPFSFILDSGAATTIIDNKFADELELERVGGMKALGIGGAESIDKVEVTEMSVGGFTINKLDLFCMDMAKIGEMLGLGESFKGIVGYDLFARAVMKLDYQNEQLTMIDPEHFEYEGPGKPVNGEIINNLICVDGVIDGDIEGKLRIDTGAAGGLHLHGDFLKEHGFLDCYKGDVEMEMFGAGGKQTIQLVKVKTLKLGEYEVKEPVSTLMMSEGGAMGTLDAMATVGNEVLSRFVVIFDYDNNRLILEPGAKVGIAGKINRAGLIVMVDDQEQIFVGAVLKGSPAEDAGFQVGDEIIQFAKLKAGKGLTAEVIQKMLFASEGTEFKIKVKRSDNILKLKLFLRDLVK